MKYNYIYIYIRIQCDEQWCNTIHKTSNLIFWNTIGDALLHQLAKQDWLVAFSIHGDSTRDFKSELIKMEAELAN